MLKSMTGFGTATVTTPTFVATVDVKSVNGRFLKTQVRVPSGRPPQERELEILVKARTPNHRSNSRPLNGMLVCVCV